MKKVGYVILLLMVFHPALADEPQRWSLNGGHGVAKLGNSSFKPGWEHRIQVSYEITSHIGAESALNYWDEFSSEKLYGSYLQGYGQDLALRGNIVAFQDLSLQAAGGLLYWKLKGYIARLPIGHDSGTSPFVAVGIIYALPLGMQITAREYIYSDISGTRLNVSIIEFGLRF